MSSEPQKSKGGRPRGFRPSAETRAKQSAASRGNRNATGHAVTPRQLANLRQFRRGEESSP